MNTIYENNLKTFLSGISLSTNDVLLQPATGILKSRKTAKIDSTFLYSSPMDTVTDLNFSQTLLEENQSPVFCRFFPDEIQQKSLNLFSKNSNFWFTVGASLEEYEALRLYFLDKKHKVNISVDVAHGDTIHMHEVYNMYSNSSFCRSLMSGTVATPASALNVAKAGCTHIRVGIGPGSACSTRIVTGCGVPNLSAVFNIWDYFQDYPVEIRPFIIADGGIKNTGDIIKYLSAGADGVMIGSLFSKCIESSGWKVDIFKKLLNKITFNKFFKNYLYKQYRGQASKDFQMSYRGFVSGTPEGVTAKIQYPTNTVNNFVATSKSAVASALSYLGLNDIAELNPKNVKFIKITSASYEESKPHILNKD